MGGIRITGIAPRFWVILGVLIALIVATLTVLKPEPDPVFDANVCPLFPLDARTVVTGCEAPNPTARAGETLSALKGDWMNYYRQANGTNTRVNDVSQFTGANYVPSLGQPMRMKVYLPPTDQAISVRPDLSRRTRGFTFVPAILIRGDQTRDLAQLGEEAATIFGSETGEEGKPLMLGFRDADLPAPGQQGAAYEINAMLYWRSDHLNPSTDAAGPVATVFLVDQVSPISTVELSAPTTHRASLDLAYQENGQELVVHDVEWSTVSSQMRVCVTVNNIGVKTLPVWAGFSATAATLAGKAPEEGTPDQTAGFAAASEMRPGNPLRGYITFSQTVDPGQQVQIEMPNLTGETAGEAEDKIRITVPRKQIKPVSQQAEARTSPCAGGSRAAESL